MFSFKKIIFIGTLLLAFSFSISTVSAINQPEPKDPICSLQEMVDGTCGDKEVYIEIDPTKELNKFTDTSISNNEASNNGSGVDQIQLIGEGITIDSNASKARIRELEAMQEDGSILYCTTIMQAPAAFQGNPADFDCQDELKYLRSKTGLGALETFAQRLISYALGFIEIIALIVLLFGAITWITAAGEDDKVTKGRTMIIWAALGLVIASIAHILITIVIQLYTG